MIFEVPKNFKGKFVLSTINQVLWAGRTISISGNDLYADDVKTAIKRGVLVPLDKNYDKEKADLSHNAILVNKTDKILVLGSVTLNKWSSLSVSKDIAYSPLMKDAEKTGLIQIISDEDIYIKNTKDEDNEKVYARQDEQKESILSGEDIKTKSKVWDFIRQEMVDAEPVPKFIKDVQINSDELNSDESDDVDFIDKKIEQSKKSKKVKSKNNKTKTSMNKKKGTTKKKKKVKDEKSVSQEDIAISLDSMGRPLKDDLQHLIDSLTVDEDVSFVDE